MSKMLNEVLAANAGYTADSGDEAKLPMSVPVYGYIYDVKTGTLVEVPEATRVGKAA